MPPTKRVPPLTTELHSDSPGEEDAEEEEEEEEESAELAFLTLAEALELAYDSATVDEQCMSAKLDAYPKSYAEAMMRPDAQFYHEAAVKEVEGLIENGTLLRMARLYHASCQKVVRLLEVDGCS